MDHFVCLQDYEDHALKVLSKTAVGFYRGGADQEQTLGDNREAFNRYKSRNILNYVKYKIVKRAFLLAVNSITQTSPELISTTIVGF